MRHMPAAPPAPPRRHSVFLPGAIVLLAGLALAAASFAADIDADEVALKEAFEGLRVAPRIDLPGTASGVNVYPQRARPVDYERLGKDLKKFGVAIAAGESKTVTKVRLKKDLIEFQLAGGGYGTFGDEKGGGADLPIEGESRREKELRSLIRAETDGARRRAFEDELDRLRHDRNRRNAVARSVNAANDARAEEVEARRRALGGSRFNVRFEGTVPAAYRTPDGLRRALAAFVDFAGAEEAMADDPGGDDAPEGLTVLRKGMAVAEVESLLGAPVKSVSRREGQITVVERRYQRGGEMALCRFVGDVLVGYTIESL
jgi:hypothetical protein